MCAAETEILYMVVVKCSKSVLQRFCDVIMTFVRPVVSWAHERVSELPSHVEDNCKNMILYRWHFRQIIDGHVKTKSPFPPLKIFKHGSHSFQSKKKAGFDRVTKLRAVVRSSTSHRQWVQNIVSQIMKTIALNAFLGWQMHERRKLLESFSLFHSLDSYSNLLSTVQLTRKLLIYVY